MNHELGIFQQKLMPFCSRSLPWGNEKMLSVSQLSKAQRTFFFVQRQPTNGESL